MKRRTILILAVAVAFAPGAAARASEMLPYSPGAFLAAQNAGRPILVHITAPWCSVCAAQKPILSRLEAQPRFKDLAVFDVDFDTQKTVVKAFGARIQSTLIGYKGATETGRSAGETKEADIAALLASTL